MIERVCVWNERETAQNRKESIKNKWKWRNTQIRKFLLQFYKRILDFFANVQFCLVFFTVFHCFLTVIFSPILFIVFAVSQAIYQDMRTNISEGRLVTVEGSKLAISLQICTDSVCFSKQIPVLELDSFVKRLKWGLRVYFKILSVFGLWTYFNDLFATFTVFSHFFLFHFIHLSVKLNNCTRVLIRPISFLTRHNFVLFSSL